MHYSRSAAEFFEASAGAPRARSSPAATTRRPAPSGGGSTSGARPTGAGGARGSSRPSRGSSSARPSPATRPSSAQAAGGRPAGRPVPPRTVERQQPRAGRNTSATGARGQDAQRGATPASSSGGSSLGSLASAARRVSSYAQQAWDFAQSGVQGVQAAQSFAASLGLGGGRSRAGQPAAPPVAAAEPVTGDTGQAPGVDGGAAAAPLAPGPEPQPAPWPAPSPATATPPPGTAASTPTPGDQFAALLQALRQHQVPALPGPAQPITPYAPARSFAAAMPLTAAAPMPLGAAAPRPSSVPAPVDAITLLRTILTNPQLQQALHPAAAPAIPRAVQLPVPMPAAPAQVRSVPIPLGAVLNAIAALAGQSMTELSEYVGEDEPEVPAYLVDDDGSFIVDPASAEDRAALVAHLFRLSSEVYGSGRAPLSARAREPDVPSNEYDQWARDAGFP